MRSYVKYLQILILSKFLVNVAAKSYNSFYVK